MRPWPRPPFRSSSSPAHSSSCWSSTCWSVSAGGTMSRLALRSAALGYLALLLLLPVGMVFWRTFEDGLGPVWEALTRPAFTHALWLSVLITLIAVPANTIFGVLCALAVVRRRSTRGSALLSAAVGLPLALSPVVVGLSLILVFGRGGWLGGW